jgi:hypothetical protein
VIWAWYLTEVTVCILCMAFLPSYMAKLKNTAYENVYTRPGISSNGHTNLMKAIKHIWEIAVCKVLQK